MIVTLLTGQRIAGTVFAAGAQVDVPDELGAEMIGRRVAVQVGPPARGGGPAFWSTDAVGNAVGLVGPDGVFVDARWFNLRRIERTVMASPPTVQVLAAHGIASGVLAPLVPTSQRWMTAYAGGAYSIINTVYYTAGQSNPGTAIRNPMGIAFDFEGTDCAVQVTSAPGHFYRIIVDDQAITDWNGTAGPGGGAVRFIRLTFAGRGPRRIRFEHTFGDIAGVIVGPTDSINGVPARGPRVAVLGDSYTAGAGAYSGISSWLWSFAAEMGWDDVVNCANGGTGYLQAGLNIQAIAPVIAQAVPADVYMIVAGRNDNPTFTPAQVGAAARNVVWAIRAVRPNAAIIVTGPIFPGAPVDRSQDTTWAPYESAIFSSVAGSAYTISTTDRAIFTGTGRAGATTGSGNGDNFIQSDATHPTQGGSDYLGVRLARLVREAMAFRR